MMPRAEAGGIKANRRLPEGWRRRSPAIQVNSGNSSGTRKPAAGCPEERAGSREQFDPSSDSAKNQRPNPPIQPNPTFSKLIQRKKSELPPNTFTESQD